MTTKRRAEFDWTEFSKDNVHLLAQCQEVVREDPHHNKQKIWRKLKSGRDALSAITDVAVLAKLAQEHRGESDRDPNVNRWILRGLSHWHALYKIEIDYAERSGRAQAYGR